MKRFLPSLGILAAVACGRSSVHEPATIEQGGAQYRITGPYAYENLAVYLLHSDARDDRDFITLDEGLKDGSVTVSEKEQEQVGELVLENKNSRALFVQEGDRVKGGKQDRIVGLSFVVPAKSGKMPIPSFCVEQGRWQTKGSGGAFTEGDAQLAPKQVRAAAKAGKDQSEVWQEVGGVKQKATRSLGAENTNTSLNETMDSEKSKKAVEPYRKWLDGILADKPDAVGVAFALNGKIEEVNLYPGHKLLAKLYPRLLGSYALCAILDKKSEKLPTCADVAAFMKEGQEKGKRTEQVAENSVTIRDLEANVHCVTEYQGKSVHAQWMRRDEKAASPPGNEQRQQLEQNAPQRR
ncbi:MAG TPA: DUF6569 family protein [Planctomycetota bacterium]|nr:DUF6569 family protein [Planctomycetota bacterium]